MGAGMDMDKELSELEQLFEMVGGSRKYCVPGTVLARVLTEDGIGWVLGLGCMHEPKQFYQAGTIRECLAKCRAKLAQPGDAP